MNEANEQARLVAEKIIKRLAADISDRAGLGDEWIQIDDKVMTEELLPTWEQIIVKEITKASGRQPSAIQTDGKIAGSVSANGSDSPNQGLAPCPLCHEPSQPFEDGYWCQNPFCDVRSFRGRTKSINEESPNERAMPQAD